MQRREVADLRTRFSVEGLAAARTAFRETAAAVAAVRQSTEAYSKATRQSVIDSREQLAEARAATDAANRQVEATRKANAERVNSARAAGQGFVANLKRELDQAVAAQKATEKALKGMRQPGQFAADEKWAKYREDRAAALASVATAKAAAQAKSAAYRAEMKAAKEAVEEAKSEGEAALRAAIANASRKARAEELASQRVERANRDARKAEVQQAKAAADQVRAIAAGKLQVRRAEQQVELEAARQREATAKEARQADAKAAREKAAAERQRRIAEARAERERAQAERKGVADAQRAARDELAAQKKALAEREKAEKATAERIKKIREALPKVGVGSLIPGRGVYGALRDDGFLPVAGGGLLAGGRGGLSGLTGLVGMASRASTGIAGIGVSATRTAAQMTVALGVQAMGTLTALAGQAARTASMVGRIGTRAGALGVAGISGTGALANKATSTASDFARQTYQVSRSTGLDYRDFQLLSDAAEKFDIDLGDIRGSMIQFQGQVRSAAQNPDSDLGKYFAEMGIALQDANGRLKSTPELLRQVVTASKRLDSTRKIDFLSKAFGEDDAGKLLPLFEAMDDAGELFQKIERRQQQLGNFVTDDDLIVAYRYKNAVKDLGSAWKGVSLEVANAVGNDVAILLTALANDIGKNRVLIAGYFRRSFDAFYSVTRDITRAVFNGAEFGAANAENPWVGSMLRGYITLRDAIGTTVRFAREARAAIEGRDDQVTEFPWIIGVRDGVTKAVADVRRFAFELKSALFGEEYNVGSAQFPWIFAIKAAFQVLVADVKMQWQDLVAVWSGEQATTALGGWLQPLVQVFGQAKAVVLEFGETVGRIWSDLSKIWNNLGNRDGLKSEAFNYEFLKKAGDGFLFLADAAKQGWEWFSKLYTVVFDLFRDYLGLNFESVVFFGAFLTFTGTARVLTFLMGGLIGLFKGVMSPLGKLITTLGAGAGLAGAIGGIGGATTTAAGAAAAATAKWSGLAGVFARIAGLLGGPLGLLLGIGGAAVTAYSLFGNNKGPMDKLAGDIAKLNDEFAATRQQFERDIQVDRRSDAMDRSRFSAEGYSAVPENDDPSAYVMGPNGQTWSVAEYNRMQREAIEQARYESYYAYRRGQSAATAGAAMPIPMQREPAGQPVNLTIDNRAGDQVTVQASMSQEEIARIRAAQTRQLSVR